MWFTGFHSNVGKTFGGVASSVLQKAIVHKIQKENFRISSS